MLQCIRTSTQKAHARRIERRASQSDARPAGQPEGSSRQDAPDLWIFSSEKH